MHEIKISILDVLRLSGLLSCHFPCIYWSHFRCQAGARGVIGFFPVMWLVVRVLSGSLNYSQCINVCRVSVKKKVAREFQSKFNILAPPWLRNGAQKRSVIFKALIPLDQAWCNGRAVKGQLFKKWGRRRGQRERGRRRWRERKVSLFISAGHCILCCRMIKRRTSPLE